MGLLALWALGSAVAQNQAIDFKKGMPFSEGYVAGKTLYVAGQQAVRMAKSRERISLGRLQMQLQLSKESSRERVFR